MEVQDLNPVGVFGSILEPLSLVSRVNAAIALQYFSFHLVTFTFMITVFKLCFYDDVFGSLCVRLDYTVQLQ